MTTKIQKWGNSLAVRLPKDVARKLDLHEGSSVAVREERDRIMIVGVPPHRDAARKDDWRKFIIPTKKKKEHVSGMVDEILYGASR